MTLSPATSASLTPGGSRLGGGIDDTAVAPAVAGYSSWYDFADPVQATLVGALKLSQLVDKGSGAQNAVQATASARPAYGRPYNLLNDHLAAYFDGSSYRMSCGSATASDRTQTAFIVGVCFSLAAIGTLIGANAAGGNQLRIETTGRISTTKENTSTLFSSSASMVVVAGTPFIIVQALSDTTIEHRLYGFAAESAAEATAFTAARTLILGENTAALGERFAGLIGEVVIYPTTLSSADITSVMAGLASKWNL